jgi:hypothetical protein
VTIKDPGGFALGLAARSRGRSGAFADATDARSVTRGHFGHFE